MPLLNPECPVLVTVKPCSGFPNWPPSVMISTFVGCAERRPSITVAAAPSLDTSVTALLTASMQVQPGAGVSREAVYAPGPTMISSLGMAFVIAWVIDRHGLPIGPQELPSTPLLATKRVPAWAAGARARTTAAARQLVIVLIESRFMTFAS